jgi:hypothetical protein
MSLADCARPKVSMVGVWSMVFFLGVCLVLHITPQTTPKYNTKKTPTRWEKWLLFDLSQKLGHKKTAPKGGTSGCLSIKE